MRVLDRRSRLNARTEPKSARSSRRREETEGLAVLRADHEDLQSEYEGFETSGGDDRYFLASRILRGLARHAQLEAEVFYPAIQRQAERQGHRKATALLREALREHQAMEGDIDRLNDVMQDDVFLRHVEDLMQQVRGHMEQEERELFPLAEMLLGEAGVMRLSRDLQQRKDEIEHHVTV
jgi:hemerythrin-like domain-containing protein